MTHRLPIIIAAGLLLAACGAAAPAPTSAPMPMATRPTAPTAPLPTAAPPPPASGSQPAAARLVYNVPADGSLRAFDLGANTEIVLGDPTAAQQILPWSPSPDGRIIALVTGRGWGVKGPDDGWTAALWAVQSDGSQPRKLLDLLPTGGAGSSVATSDLRTALTTLQQPVWTPDGAAIIVASAHEGQVDLYTVAPNGGQVRRLTNSPAMETRLSLAPDGRALAFVSTTGFGTGGGWANIEAAAVPLGGGQPRDLLAPAGRLPPAGAEVLGWTQAGAAMVAAYSPEPAVTVTLTGPASGPEVIYQGLGSGLAWDAASEQLAIIAGDLAQPANGAALRIWRPGQPAPATAARLPAVAAPHWAPGGQALLLCADRHDPPQLTLWAGGALKALGKAACADLAWSAQGQVAVSSEDQPGLVAAPDGRPLGTLPPGAVLAGWRGAELYSVRHDERRRWQLMWRTAHEEAPIPLPVEQRPEAVKLVPGP